LVSKIYIYASCSAACLEINNLFLRFASSLCLAIIVFYKFSQSSCDWACSTSEFISISCRSLMTILLTSFLILLYSVFNIFSSSCFSLRSFNILTCLSLSRDSFSNVKSRLLNVLFSSFCFFLHHSPFWSKFYSHILLLVNRTC
jgi:hypothetical protein